MHRTTALIPAIILTALVGSCTSRTTPKSGGNNAAHAKALAPVNPPALAEDKPRDYPGLHNVVAYHNGYYSGSSPDGQIGFDTLSALGIRTIITVDGAAPDVESAKARGIRYIHLPIGYNGFDETRKLELVRATRDSLNDGPVYIHCHHGKHRSAGAAAAVAVSLGWMDSDEAVARMKVSGTAPNYKGLYACAVSSTVMAAGTIDAVPANFPEVAAPQGFVKGMVEIDEANEHLKAIETAGWKTPGDHPDLVAVAEAGRLTDLLRLLADGDRAKKKPPEFAAMLSDNSQKAGALEDMLAGGIADTAKLSAQFKAVNASCKDCHVKFRD